MKRKNAVISVLILIVAAVILTFELTNEYVSGKYQEKVNSTEKTGGDFGILSEVDELVRKEFVGSVKDPSVIRGILKGYLDGLGDKYSYYLTAAEYNSYKNENTDFGVGTGMRVACSDDDKNAVIFSVFPDSPAEKEGIQKGDVLYSVNGALVGETGAVNAVSALAGTAGELVKVIIRREVAAIVRDFEFTLEKKKLYIPTVDSEFLDGNIGLIRIYSFGEKTADEFLAALNDLTEKGAVSLILDLRNNAGGRISSAVRILDRLTPYGVMYRVTDNNGNTENILSDDISLNMPMAVLVNSETASAAEVLAAGLKDLSGAVLIGERTFGKGRSQSVFELSDGSAVILSTKLYLPPVSPGFDGGVGLTPDFSVSDDGKNIYYSPNSEDTQLQTAIAAVDGGAKK